jgi:chromosome segregation ATPase
MVRIGTEATTMPSQTQSQTLIKLTAGLENLTQALESLRQDWRDGEKRNTALAIKLTGMETHLEVLRDDIKALQVLVRDGGQGQEPIVQRTTRIEEAMKDLIKDVAELQSCIDAAQSARILSRGQFWAVLLGMVATAVLALGAILAQLFRG